MGFSRVREAPEHISEVVRSTPDTVENPLLVLRPDCISSSRNAPGTAFHFCKLWTHSTSAPCRKSIVSLTACESYGAHRSLSPPELAAFQTRLHSQGPPHQAANGPPLYRCGPAHFRSGHSPVSGFVPRLPCPGVRSSEGAFAHDYNHVGWTLRLLQNIKRECFRQTIYLLYEEHHLYPLAVRSAGTSFWTSP
jgi:hypothetical protein